jgi:uncharacterized protein
MQPERDHGFEGEHVGYGVLSNRKYRETWPNGYFSFTLNVLHDQSNYLIVVYTKKEIETMNAFDLSVDGLIMEKGTIELEELNTFAHVKYEIPIKATAGKDRIKVNFTPHSGQRVPKVFGLRVVKE